MARNTRESFIVTADDYGIRKTAEPILRLVQVGKIDRVAVLIRYVSAEQVAALLKTGVRIDLHLELIHILKSGDKIQAGVFVRIMNFFFQYSFGTLTTTRVEDEWRSQIIEFQKMFGHLPDGLNSHEHLHYFPPFFRVYMRLADEYTISYVRFGKSGLLPRLHRSLIGIILSFLWGWERVSFAGTERVSSDYVISLDWLSDLHAFCEQAPEGCIELVVHPEREEEYRAIVEYL